MRYLITGTPRSGTTYVADLLTRVGLDCAHETALRSPYPDGRFRISPSVHWGESSWMAAAAMDIFSVPKIHLVRAPVDVIESMYHVGWIRTDLFRPFIEPHCPKVFKIPYSPDRLARFWLDWNALVDRHRIERWHVATISAAHLRAMAASLAVDVGEDECQAVLDVTPTNVNHIKKGPRLPLSLADFSSGIGGELQRRARRYGIPLSYRDGK